MRSWIWYCRLCGDGGHTPTQDAQVEAASAHLRDTTCGRGAQKGTAARPDSYSLVRVTSDVLWDAQELFTWHRIR